MSQLGAPLDMSGGMGMDPSMMGAPGPQPGGENREFETAFAELSFAVLQSETPMLLDYLVGFELIDKNEEETHAIGVFGFKLGNQMLYAPVFFVNGQLKGNELLYISNLDTFVPRVDSWVQYLLHKKPLELGASEFETEKDLGISAPDLSKFIGSPSGKNLSTFQKYNSAQSNPNIPKLTTEWVKGCAGMFNWDPAKYKCITKLSEFLYKTASYGTGDILLSSLKDDLITLQGIMDLAYSDKLEKNASQRFLIELVDIARRTEPQTKKASMKMSDVLFGEDSSIFEKMLAKYGTSAAADLAESKLEILQDFPDISKDWLLSDKEINDLMKGEIVVKDSRTNTSKVYRADYGKALMNPSDSGKYELLVKEGTLETVYVIVTPSVIGPGKCNVALVIDEDLTPLGYYRTKDLWVTNKFSPLWDELYKKGSDPKNMNIGDIYILVNQSSAATEPFRVLNKVTNSDNDIVEVWVRAFEDTGMNSTWDYLGNGMGAPITISRPDYRPFVDTQYTSFYGPPNNDWSNNDGGKSDELKYWQNGRRMLLNPKNNSSKLSILGTTTQVPGTFKAVKLKPNSESRIWKETPVGTISSLTAAILKTSSVKFMTVQRDGFSYYIDLDGKQSKPMNKRAALVSLMKQYNMKQADAQAIIDDTASTSRYFIKTAYSLPLLQEPNVGFDPGVNATMTGPMNSISPVSELETSRTRPRLDDTSIDSIRQSLVAAQSSGQQDIFDVSVLGGLVKSVKIDKLIDEYLSDMISGLDKVGRILFMYYWHNDKFAARYGQSELIELEDSLQNVFESLGDLVLFLKKRTAGELIDGRSANIDLAQIL